MGRFKLGLMFKIVFVLAIILVIFQTHRYFNQNLAQQIQPLYFPKQILIQNRTRFKEDLDDITWFAQVSDTHISKFKDPDRAKDLVSLCRFLSSRVRPESVVISGDLTDGKNSDNIGSGQHLDEWITYNQVVNECQKKLHLNWLDLRGNHDVFHVSGHESEFNYFRNYSSTGQKIRPMSDDHDSSYLMLEGSKKISFLALDMNPMPGLGRPLNFFGSMTETEENRTRLHLKEMKEKSDYQVVFGHYPTSSVLEPAKFRNLLRGDNIYLSGHFHCAYGNLFGLYTRHKSGLLELELGDWKDYRRYRIGAFDQGIFTFSDQTFRPNSSNLAMMVSSPKDPRFTLRREMENLKSPEIRILAFADFEIAQISVRFSNGVKKELKNRALPQTNLSPLYVTDWSDVRDNYAKGIHNFTILVRSKSGEDFVQDHLFSLDGSSVEYGFMSRVILMMDWNHFSQLAFMFLTSCVWLFLVALRTFQPKNTQNRSKWFLSRLILKVTRKYFMMANLPNFFQPISLALLWQLVLPWYVGRVLEDQFGLVFSWGVLLLDEDNQLNYKPPDLNTCLASFSILFQVIPGIWILASKIEQSFYEITHKYNSEKQVYNRNISFHFLSGMCAHFWFLLLFLIMCFTLISLGLSYGAISVFSPVGLGKMFLYVILYRRAVILSPQDVRKLQMNWS